MNQRYSVEADPSGLYYVWDEREISPVMAGEDIRTFLTFKLADRAASELNRPAGVKEHRSILSFRPFRRAFRLGSMTMRYTVFST